MLFRIWRTGVKRERLKEYEEFERSYSLPMFERQEGCLGVVPKDVVHPGSSGGWRCRSHQSQRRSPDESAR
jgi:hypothetical protein